MGSEEIHKLIHDRMLFYSRNTNMSTEEVNIMLHEYNGHWKEEINFAILAKEAEFAKKVVDLKTKLLNDMDDFTNRAEKADAEVVKSQAIGVVLGLQFAFKDIDKIFKPK